MKRKYFWLTLIVLIAAASVWGPIVSNVEQAKYTVIEKQDTIEIRDYAPMIVAEAEASGDREYAINQGFRMIADYIFGNNISSQKVAMTAPVTQQASEKIAMTAPVTQRADDSGNWKVRFVMPSAYAMDTLPKPKNEAVALISVPGKRYAAIRFSGIANQSRLNEEKAKLESFIKEHGLEPLDSATYAFFNPPWTLPFFRRNEVMIEISQ